MSSRADRWLAVGLGALALAYVAALPRTLGESDEGLVLYEAVSILRGEVYFRDVFDFIPPGAHAYYATLFALFGVSIDTARIGTALLHGVIVFAIFAGCRRLQVRSSFAALAALAHLAIAQPAWPYAAPHWLSAALVMLFLLRALAPGGIGRAAMLGALSGLIAAVHQQKGFLMLCGGGALLLAEFALSWRFARRAPLVDLVKPLLALAAGCAAVAVPFFGGLVLWAGFAPTWAALIDFPLQQYASFHHVAWGEVTLLSGHLAAYTFPRLLAWLPLALLPVAVGAAARLARGVDEAMVRRLLALLIVAAVALVATRYNADFIHLAYIAPLMLIAAGVDLEWLLVMSPSPLAGEGQDGGSVDRCSSPHPGLPPQGRKGSLTVKTLLGVLALLIAFQMGRNVVRARREYPHVADTAFGRIALRRPDVATLVDAVRVRAAAAPSRQVFVYPTFPALYLMTGTDNPTPFQLLVADYSSPAAFDAALAALERSRAPLVVALETLVPADDRVMAYVRAHYDRDRDGLPPSLDSIAIYRRRAE